MPIPIQLTASGDATVRLWDVMGGVTVDEFKRTELVWTSSLYYYSQSMSLDLHNIP